MKGNLKLRHSPFKIFFVQYNKIKFTSVLSRVFTPTPKAYLKYLKKEKVFNFFVILKPYHNQMWYAVSFVNEKILFDLIYYL